MPMQFRTDIRVRVSPECRLVDLSAFLESYAVEMSSHGKILCRVPVSMCFKPTATAAAPACNCRYWTLKVHQCKERRGQPILNGPGDIDARLIQFTPPADPPETCDACDSISACDSPPCTKCGGTGELPARPVSSRWPFYVDSPLVVCISADDHWWQFTFSPGKTYQERSIDPCAPEVFLF
jgi:hypothetical protein